MAAFCGPCAAKVSATSGHEISGHNMSKLRMVVDRIYIDTDYLSVPDGSFDAVTMLDVLEHVPDPQATVLACARILRPGGLLYLHTPCVSRLDGIMHA
jgi:2-polyprenyl-3-methyl-5-hydroxy-6-metoxy-1,4-benzoquinol methylase